ncbi:MAG: LysR substrate-binding domain-containing protein [Pelagimonas sp.]|jgi:DNA-binding transcriptional LysR family regulator|nr:LysR substrate-binding domain-containing protein [Pelagimonas sp.]
MKAKISMKQLQALEAVARLGSFTVAAKELGVSQPTVSNLIYALEKQYECRLLDRSGAEIRPTPIFAAIRGHAKAIMAHQDALHRHLTEGRDLNSGMLRVGYTTYQLAMPVLADFVRSHPGVELTARSLATNDLLPILFNGEFDAGFITSIDVPSGLEGVAIAPAQIGLVVPENHALAGRDSVNWSDVAGLELIQREPSSGTRRVFEAAANLARVPIRTRLGLGSWGSILALVRSGVGVGVCFATEYAQEPDLRFLPINDSNLSATHFLVCLPAMRHTAAVARLFDLAMSAKCDSLVSGDRS